MTSYPKTILCVDDDEDDLLMLRNAFKESGEACHIIEAFDGLHALDILGKLKDEGEVLPCLIVLDINMPRMNGKAMLVALKRDEALAAILVVLFTTSSSDVDINFSLAKQVQLITKPMNIAALAMVASNLLTCCED